MPRDAAPSRNGQQTFERLKHQLGRLPTVDELSLQLEAARPRRRAPIASLAGLALIAAAVVMAGQIELPSWLLPDTTAPDLPSAPAVDATASVPPLPEVAPPPPAPVLEQPPARPQRKTAAAKPTSRPVARQVANVAPAPRDDGPAIQQRVLPQIPASARRTITGRVRIDVRVSVDSSGRVTGADSLSPDASKYFTSLTLKAAQDWTFAPAEAPRDWTLRFGIARGDTTVTAVPR